MDERGVRVHLAGVVLSNEVWGAPRGSESEERERRGDDPLFRPTVLLPWVLAEPDFEQLATLPGNVVRYDVNHELFAEDNADREANVSKLLSHVARLAAIGRGVILDLQMPIGLDVQSDVYERRKPGRLRERSLVEDEGYFEATVRTWCFLARALASQPTLVAYEICNEPRVPCEAEGGLGLFQRRLEGLARAIRASDSRHLILIPEHNSREANPGETYPDPAGGEGTLVDRGEQGVRWDRGFVRVEVDNVGYVFHLYEPWSFTAQGASEFDPGDVERVVLEKVRWRDRVGRAPLVVTEYGVNWKQPAARRAAWLAAVHERLGAHGIGATYFNYKAAVGPHVRPEDTFALFGQFVGRGDLGSREGRGYRLDPAFAEVARRTGFDVLLGRWFRDLGPSDLSLMDNAPLIEELERFAAGGSALERVRP